AKRNISVYFRGRFVQKSPEILRFAQNDIQSHLELFRFFASVASVFKSGVRENGSRPNKFPSANAGSAFNFFSSCTPAIRASSVSKCETARAVGSFASR